MLVLGLELCLVKGFACVISKRPEVSILDYQGGQRYVPCGVLFVSIVAVMCMVGKLFVSVYFSGCVGLCTWC